MILRYPPRPLAPVCLLISVVAMLFSGLITSGPVAAGGLAATLLLLMFIGAGDRLRISPVSFVALAYLLGYPSVYVAPHTLYPGLWRSVPDPYIEMATVWGFRGVTAFATGYFAVLTLHRSRGKQARNPNSALVDIAALRMFCYMLGAISVLAWVSAVFSYGTQMTFVFDREGESGRGVSSLVQILHVLTLLRLPFFSLSFVIWYRGFATRQLLYLSFIVFALYIIDVVIMGSKGELMRGVAAFGISAAALGLRYRPRTVLAAVAAGVLVVGSFPVVTEYRRIVTAEVSRGNGEVDLGFQAAAFGDALMFGLGVSSKSNRSSGGQSAPQQMLERYAAPTHSLGNMFRHTTGVSPKEHFIETFLVPMYAIVPRALTPEKPEYLNSGENARRYYGSTRVAISVSLLGSLYHSLGYAGMIYGMIIIGGMLGFLVSKSEVHGLERPVWFVMLVLVTISLMDVGGTVHAVITNVVRVGLLASLLWSVSRQAAIRSTLRRAVDRRDQSASRR